MQALIGCKLSLSQRGRETWTGGKRTVTSREVSCWYTTKGPGKGAREKTVQLASFFFFLFFLATGPDSEVE